MLGQPVSMLIPEVIGFKLTANCPQGVTATDLVLTCTEMLRKKKVVGKFVEFYGPGLSSLALADRATIANMAPEYGATMGFFPVDDETLKYLRLSGRSEEQVRWSRRTPRRRGSSGPTGRRPRVHRHARTRPVDGRAESLAGPKRPQDRIAARDARRTTPSAARRRMSYAAVPRRRPGGKAAAAVMVARATPGADLACDCTRGQQFTLKDGAVVIAAITSCTNTVQPERDARGRPARAEGVGRRGSPPSRGSRPRWRRAPRWPRLLRQGRVQPALNALGFRSSATAAPRASATPARCRRPSARRSTTASSRSRRCSRATATSRAASIRRRASTTSPRRRWSWRTRWPAAWTSTSTPSRSASGAEGPGVPARHLADARRKWRMSCSRASSASSSRPSTATSSPATPSGRRSVADRRSRYAWDDASTYVKHPPYFDGMTMTPPGCSRLPAPACSACSATRSRPTTSRPAGSIAERVPAGQSGCRYGVEKKDFNSYGAVAATTK
jgi:aconitate hydratase